MNLIKTARGRITTYHGEDAGRSRPHVGIDIGHGDGTPDDLHMVAPAAGRVVAASWEGTYGNRVIIQHPDGSRSLIAHMASLGVSAGQEVEQGQGIGVMGRTGGPWGSIAGWFVHGHQEYHVGGIAVDPLAYMDGGTAHTGKAGWLMALSDAQQEDLYRRVVNLDRQLTGADGFYPSVAHRVVNLDQQLTGADNFDSAGKQSVAGRVIDIQKGTRE